MEKLKIHVITGSTRPNRFSEHPAKWIFEIAKKREDLEVELLDLRDYPMPFYDEPVSPSQIQDGKYPHPVVQKWADTIRVADGFIVVGPEYNHGYSAVLKNAFDHIYYEWNKKAVGFVSYGSVGGGRAVEQMRLVAVELQMAPMRAAVHIPAPWNLQENGGLKEGALEPFVKSAEGLIDQLAWWTAALKVARPA